MRDRLSDVLHGCVVDAFGLPADKRFHRFIYLDDGDFIYPDDRSRRYTIIEIQLFEGRSVEAKKRLIRLVYERFERDLDIAAADIEINMIESPKHNWGIRGVPADELALNYTVKV